ncbi:fibrinogen C domain-containing protein 1-A-like isoform X4 [Apostichopus japonicus]|uniref:fibrinogen C domain-containing protein 1-A-like isoform X4 n=1 Tax=Stichopus japonicus TaxID=307972 RepID=UPI003AB8D61F
MWIPRKLRFLVQICFFVLSRNIICFHGESNQQLFVGATEGKVHNYFFLYQRQEYPRDCHEVLHRCSSTSSSGVYLIKPDGYAEPFEVYCDNSVDDGGWTIIQRRFDGSINFNRSWEDYQLGFGFLSSELWIGNKRLSYLTNQKRYQLRIDLTTTNGSSFYVTYDKFRISDVFSNYKLVKAEITNRTVGGTVPSDCKELYNNGERTSGVYEIKPTIWPDSPFEVYCNMSDGGGWTVFQRRVDDSQDFYLYWDDYKIGFGNRSRNFWLGNEKIYSLTNQRQYELRIDFVDYGGAPYYAKYEFFRISDENDNFRLDVGDYSDGDAGDSLTYHDDQPFTTRDNDNDDYDYTFFSSENNNIARYYDGAWWYGYYYYSSLNSPYGGYYFYWGTLPVYNYIKFTEMKVRAIDEEP